MIIRTNNAKMYINPVFKKKKFVYIDLPSKRMVVTLKIYSNILLNEKIGLRNIFEHIT